MVGLKGRSLYFKQLDVIGYILEVQVMKIHRVFTKNSKQEILDVKVEIVIDEGNC